MAGWDDDVLPPLTTEDKMLSGLCYPFWVVMPAFVLCSHKKHDPFLAFHAFQGLALGLLQTLFSVLCVPFLWLMFSSLPTTYTMTSGLMGVLLTLVALGWMTVCFAMLIFMGWQASSGRFLRFPFLGERCELWVGRMLEVDAEKLHRLAVDRELEPDEKVTVIAPIPTPEQFAAEMDRFAAQAQPSWWGDAGAESPAQRLPEAPAASAPQAPVEVPRQAPRGPEPVRFPAAERPRAPEAPKGPEKVKFPSANAPSRPGAPAEPRPSLAPRPPVAPARTDAEVRPWRPASAHPASPSPSPAPPAAEPQVKPWRPAAANATPQAKPVSFPSVPRSGETKPEEKQKWWQPKD